MMRKYHVRFGGGARVPEGSPALPYPSGNALCAYPVKVTTRTEPADTVPTVTRLAPEP